MAGRPIDERKFSDREVRAILKKAVERTPSRAVTKSEGLSLAELKSIGQEVGIDPDRLEDAAQSLIVTGENQAHPLVGIPVVLSFDRKVKGEIGPEDTPEILTRIRRIMGHQGEVDEIHGSLEWSAKGEAGGRFVSISSRDGTTTVQSSANLSDLAVVTYLPGGILGTIATTMGFIVAANNASPVGMVLSLSILPVLYPLMRGFLRKIARRETTKLEQVVDDLARMAEESGEE